MIYEMHNRLKIPEHFYKVRHNLAVHPGTGHSADLADGANCQVFAYSLLAHFGTQFPPLRSSELWDDTLHSVVPTTLDPLDMLLFSSSREPFGAHVAVYLGDGLAIHLSKIIGLPAEWALDEFAKHPEYRFFIGAKRAIARA